MSQYYTRAFAFANYEVKIHFCGAKCGKEVDLIRYLTYSDTPGLAMVTDSHRYTA